MEDPTLAAAEDASHFIEHASQGKESLGDGHHFAPPGVEPGLSLLETGRGFKPGILKAASLKVCDLHGALIATNLNFL